MLRVLLISIILLSPTLLFAQIDLDAYKKYMSEHEDISYEELLEEFDVGKFARFCPTDYSKAFYFDSTNKFMNFTTDEMQLIKENGFVVTDRKEVENYIKGYYNIYVNDLPVYISADLFTHSLFYSLTDYMKEAEINGISGRYFAILNEYRKYVYHNRTDILSDATLNEEYKNTFRDVDFLFFIAANISYTIHDYDYLYQDYEVDSSYYKTTLNSISDAYTAHNSSDPDFSYLQEIELPSGNTYTLDLSQLMPRGHYDTDELRSYFMSMMWMSRFFMTIPEKEKDVNKNRYMILMSAMIRDFVDELGVRDNLEELDNIMTFFISAQNNLSIKEVDEAYEAIGVSNLQELLDKDLVWEYCKALRATGKGVQLYNTQIVKGNDFESDSQAPQYFSLLGQRPILDGFVLGNVVYPMITDESVMEPIRRMLPESMDILFALGNDASAHLLENTINKYLYADNLASCRYLFDNMDEEEWNSSIYNLWMKALRTINPPKDRENLPKFMQAAAWQHKNMNTQLASWTELRHLTVLYAKQSYTGMPLCDFPDFFIEPRPEFFEVLGELNNKIIEFHDLVFKEVSYESKMHLERFVAKKQIFESLEEISRKQYSHEPLTESQKKYLKTMIYIVETCEYGRDYATGWIYDLFGLDGVDYVGKYNEVDEGYKPKRITTDVHTSPSDENENIVGWVKHAATGDQNYCTIVTENQSGNLTTYTGVVNSYYEYVTENFKRDKDEEWLEKMDQIPAPSFTNVYKADKSGNKKATAELVRTYDVGVEDNIFQKNNSVEIYPSVFEDDFTIAINSVESYTDLVEVAMYSSEGEVIFTKQFTNIPNGQILINPAEYGVSALSAGVYIIELRMGDTVFSGKAIKIK